MNRNIKQMLKQIVKIAVVMSVLWPQICLGVIRIAVIAPKSGEQRLWGEELVKGAQIAVDELNKSGGIHGQKVDLMSIDDACSDNLAVSTAELLAVGMENKPALVVGPYCGNSFDRIAAIYSGAKIFQVVPTVVDARYQAENYKGMVKMVGSTAQVGRDFFQFYNKHFAGDRVALIFEGSTQEKSFAALADEFRRYGKTSLLSRYDLKDYESKDILAQIISASGVKAVVVAASPKKTGKMIRSLKQTDKNMVIFTSKYLAGDSFFENAADYLDTVYFAALPEYKDSPELAETLVALRLKGIEFEGLNIYGYASVMMWAELVAKTGSTSYDELAAKIKGGKTETLWGKSFFNNSNPSVPLHYVFYQYKNGDYVQVD